MYRHWRAIAEQLRPAGPAARRDLGRDDRASSPRSTAMTTSCSWPSIPAGLRGLQCGQSRRDRRPHAGGVPASGCPVWTASNHDVNRFPSRWCGGDRGEVKLALLVIATLPGTLVLYYGDEIGMTDVLVPPELARDTFGGPAGRPAATGPERRCSGTTPRRRASPRQVFSAGFRRRPGRVQCRRPAGRPVLGADVLPELARLRRERDQPRQHGYERLAGPAGVWRYVAGELRSRRTSPTGPATLPEPVGRVLLSTGTAARPILRFWHRGRASYPSQPDERTEAMVILVSVQSADAALPNVGKRMAATSRRRCPAGRSR